ncbi:Chondroitin sulfate synthase 1 [Geodia barretti]|uniref:Hexosyltransferase n=1 Tax=Geodia barretti TaxID=519541 RepID=A0AA35SW57_GEOBA|nr:Chondroitin sulfate synthase 1 [Geodia barretti]
MRVKIPGRCFSLRSVLRDSLMLLAGTVMGILLSRAIFDVRGSPTSRQLALSKRLTALPDTYTTAAVRLAITAASIPDNESSSELWIQEEEATKVVLGSAGAGPPVVNSALVHQQRARTAGGKDVISMQKRPKTLAEELGGNMKRPLFVGVVTSKKLLPTRGVAINKTWGQTLGQNIRFFSSANTHPLPNLPVVSLPGTDDTYPPQKKVYRMLKYMYDHFINQYNWFMRADDDLYVRVGPLVEFLSTLDPSTDLYIGQPGIGKPDDWERIQLYPNEHYCMGGPGVVLSRSLLVKLAPHLEECLGNVVVSWNEDLEVGRCIMRRLAIQCTWSYELKDKFYQDYSMGEIFNSSDVYHNQKLQNILTLHPLKSPRLMYRVHQFFLELALSRAESKAEHVHWDLEKISALTGKGHAFS